MKSLLKLWNIEINVTEHHFRMHNTLLQEVYKIINKKYTMYNAFIVTNYMPVSTH